MKGENTTKGLQVREGSLTNCSHGQKMDLEKQNQFNLNNKTASKSPIQSE